VTALCKTNLEMLLLLFFVLGLDRLGIVGKCAASPLLRTTAPADLMDHRNAENAQQEAHHRHHYRKQIESPADAFTVIFLSDMECSYRNHTPERCRYVLEYIRDLAQQNLYFDGNYGGSKMDPQLVIHGGDNNSMLGCKSEPASVCRSVQQEWDDIWKTPFEGNLPLISAFGNHDWQTAEGTGDMSSLVWGDPSDPRVIRTDVINSGAQELVAKTYEESAKLGVETQEFAPIGEIGPIMYRSTFRGIQIANFNVAVFWESYNDQGVYNSESQVNALFQSLDRNMATLFFQHYPLGDTCNFSDFWCGCLGFFCSEIIEKTVDRIQEFPRAILLTGHRHKPRTQDYPTFFQPDRYSFVEYVAPYPHTWDGLAPGFYAMLVSPTEGVLQVKQVEVPGLDDGEPCDMLDTCKLCGSGANLWSPYSETDYRCGVEPLAGSGAPCPIFLLCNDICPNTNDDGVKNECPWWGLFLFFCTCV